MEIADALHGEELEEVGMMLGHDPKTMSHEMLIMEINKSIENPNKVDGKKTGADIFMDIIESETRVELSILKRGFNTGILEETHDKGICFNGVTLGYNEAECLNFLRTNSAVKTSIDLRSRKSQEGTNQAMARREVVVDVKDAEIQNSKRKIAELEERLRQANAVAANKTASEDLSELEADGVNVIDSSTDEELEALIKEGNSLVIKGIHLLGKNKPLEERKRLVKEKIDSVKDSVQK